MTQPGPIAAKVLLAWNGSPAAAAGLTVAEQVARQLGAQLEVLHVWRDAKEEQQQGSQREEEARRLGMAMRFEIGDAADEIIRLTEEPGVLLVTLTTHGREIEPGYRLGSVAEKVVAHTTRPVLIVKPESTAAKARGGLRRLLVPIDGTPKTATALRPVTELAAALGGSIDLLYVADGPAPTERGSMTAPRYVDQPQHEWPAWAAEVIHRLATCCAGCPPEVPVRIFLARGDIGEEIARFATENQADAIVLVRRSKFQPGRAKVIRSVLSQTSCFVVIVGGEDV
ncbi:MAG TPA: universal stress protein [Dehalococcoidia bacterium]|nr:universal stress protein [Dehalococcoidia bacterium]